MLNQCHLYKYRNIGIIFFGIKKNFTAFMLTSKFKIFLAVVIANLFFVTSCKKVENSTEFTSNEPSLIVIQKNVYQPFEAIFFKMDKPWSNAPDSILFGGTFMKIFNQDSFLVGVCPELVPGKYTVKINDKFKYEVDLIKNADIDPIKVYDSLMLITESIKMDPNIAKQIGYLQDVVKNEWAKLSESEKKQMSQFLLLNHFVENDALDFGDLSFLDSINGRNENLNIDVAQNKFFISFLKSKVLLVTGIAAIGVGVLSAKTGFGLIAIGAGCILVYKYKNSVINLINEWSISAIQFDNFSTVEKRGVLQLVNGISTKVSVKGNCSNISQNDRDRKDAQWLFGGLNEIKSSVDKLNSFINKFLSYMPGVEQIEWLNDGYLNPKDYKKTLPLYFGNLAIKNVSNSKIKLTLQEDVNGGIKVLTESTLTDSTDFQFTLEYKSKYKFDAPNATKTFDAKFVPNSLNGLWVCQNLTDFNEKNFQEESCDTIKYNLIIDLNLVKRNFNLSSDSLIWYDETQVKESYTNRPSKCGGPYVFQSKEIISARFKVTNRSGSVVNFVGDFSGETFTGSLTFSKLSDENNYSLNFQLTPISGGDPGISFSNIKCIR